MVHVLPKKICFITTSTEPGLNAIGDYTRTMAKLSHDSGFEVTIIAARDEFVKQEFKDESNGYHIYRIPPDLAGGVRTNSIKRTLDLINPDLVNVQFSLYNFHPKGLPLFQLGGLGKLLSKIPHKQLMMHSLWTGIAAPNKSLLIRVGSVQQLLIKRFLRNYNPQQIFANTDIFVHCLIKSGYENVAKLPLVSNIAYAPQWSRQAVDLLKNAGMENPDEYFKIGFFGSVYNIMPLNLRNFLENTLKKSMLQEKKLAIIFFGKSTKESIKDFKKKSGHLLEHIQLFELGMLSEELVSGVMLQLNYGGVTTPSPFEGKSGVRAAYLLHNVRPVSLGISPPLNKQWKDFTPPENENTPLPGPDYNQKVWQLWKNHTLENK